jgi:GNAT superfamily N-acetyltransferase
LQPNSATTYDANVRAARTDDLAALTELAAQLGYPADQSTIAGRLEAILSGKVDNDVLVATDTVGNVVGFVHVSIRPLLVADRTAEICGLVVTESTRGNGHGKRLMAAAEKWARERDCVEVSLRSNIIREDAHQFYKCIGYEVYKTSLAFKKKLDR